jgi:hypothetical protein
MTRPSCGSRHLGVRTSLDATARAGDRHTLAGEIEPRAFTAVGDVEDPPCTCNGEIERSRRDY